MVDSDWRTRLGEQLALKGVKVTELSERLGRHRDYVSRVTKGEAQPSAELLMELFQITGIRYEDVMFPKPSSTGRTAPEVDETPLKGSLEQLQTILNTDTFKRNSED